MSVGSEDMSGRHIIIGDIHGCADALVELLDACDRRPEDEVISVGDIIDRGPDPTRVVQFFMTDENAVAILGNHEDKHIRIRAGELRPYTNHLLTELQLGDFYHAALDWFTKLPLSRERCGHFICHAGVVPGIPLANQDRNALLRAKMPWMDRLFDDSHPPWWTQYDGEVPIVYGHSVHPDGVLQVNNTIGVDTGAWRGHKLSALVLPEQRVVSVETEALDLMKIRAPFAAELDRLSDAYEQRHAKPKKTVAPPIIVEGVTINGHWLLEHYDQDRGGPWVGKVLSEIRKEVENGRLSSKKALLAMLPSRFTELIELLVEWEED